MPCSFNGADNASFKLNQNYSLTQFILQTHAVRTQIYIAISTYTLVAIIKAKLKLKQSPYEILQIMSVSLLDKTRLPSLFENPLYQDVKDQNHIQLKINLI